MPVTNTTASGLSRQPARCAAPFVPPARANRPLCDFRSPCRIKHSMSVGATCTSPCLTSQDPRRNDHARPEVAQRTSTPCRLTNGSTSPSGTSVAIFGAITGGRRVFVFIGWWARPPDVDHLPSLRKFYVPAPMHWSTSPPRRRVPIFPLRRPVFFLSSRPPGYVRGDRAEI